MTEFSFFLREYTVETEAFPSYSEGFAVRYTDQPGQVFKRKTVDGELRFFGADFLWIMAKGVNQMLYLSIKDDEGSVVVECQFTRRQGTTNYDNSIFTVTPTVVDGYETILTALDREVNWLHYYPDHSEVEIPVMPIIQIYEAGSTKITCYSYGHWWTQTVENPTFLHSKLLQDFVFGDKTEVWTAMTTDPTLSSYQFSPTTYLSDDGLMRIVEQRQANPDYDPIEPWIDPPFLYRWAIVDVLSGDTLYAEPEYNHPEMSTTDSLFRNFLEDPAQTKTLRMRRRKFYMRMVSANGDAQEWTMVKPDDIMPKSIYRFAVQLDPTYMGEDGVIAFGGIEDEENRYTGSMPHFTGWPKTPENHPTPGYEYVAPTSLNADCVPLDPDSWDGFSYWFMPTAQHAEWVSAERYTYRHILKDAYRLHGVIAAMLRGANIPLQHELTDSSFFTGGMATYLTPKGNILTWGYDNPVSVSGITLGQLLETLKKVFKVYWHVDGGRLKMEHISWYMRGGQATGEPTLNLDLTATFERRRIKNLDFELNTVQYDALNLPFGMSYAWADESSQMFKGWGIQYHGATYPGIDLTVEEERAELVSADLQHALVNPDRYAKEGLFVINAVRSLGASGLSVPYYTFTVGDATYRVMNGRMSFAYLLKEYHGDDLLTWAHYINTIYTEATLVKASMTQTVNFPYQVEINWLRPFKTGVGTGFIKELQVNIDTGYVSGTLALPEPNENE